MQRSGSHIVQGGALKTWSFQNPHVERVHLVLRTDGRPLDADVALWQGPDNIPHRMRVYVEDGAANPFSAVIETPRNPNTVAIRNTGQLEFPLSAHVMAEEPGRRTLPSAMNANIRTYPHTIQGGALRTYPFDPSVESMQLRLETDGRPLQARIELLQGPNHNKQVVEVYTQDGYERPVYMVVESPMTGGVLRIVNTGTVEFPITAAVEPYVMNRGASYALEPMVSGDWR